MKIKKPQTDKPEEGKIYALTGTTNSKCILNGYSWKESEVKASSRKRQATKDLTGPELWDIIGL